jgi:hypothetical protein
MCQRQILSAVAGTGDNQALDNRNSGENTIGINVDVPAVIAVRSTENKDPSLVARTHGAGSISDSKGGSAKRGSQNGDEPSSDKESEEDKKKKKERAAKIKERAKKIREENEKRWEAAKAKGNGYELYDPNDINEV